MPRHDARPLWIAFFCMAALTAVYLWVVLVTGSFPAASDFFGHSLGILGFLLMLMTEVLYSLRKRSPRFAFGRLSVWLEFHIVMGLVGPYMVLLHSSWKFNGLAGLVTLLTVIIVLSGFVGRYIYTALPRTDDGLVLEAEQVSQKMRAAQADFQQRLAGLDAPARQRVQNILRRPQSALRWWLTLRRLPAADRAALNAIRHDSLHLAALQRQHQQLAGARRALSLWHAIHIPIGLTLFTAAFIHIGAAIYYATLLR